MLPICVTILATVPQGSEIPEGLMNNPVFKFAVGIGTGVAKCRGSVVRPRNVGAIAGCNQPFSLPHSDQSGCGGRPASHSVSRELATWFRLVQRFSNFFQVGTTFISQNVLRTTLLLGLSNSLGLP